MQDYYYSKALDQYFPTRLDYLLYAHDGRGLGHVSRTTAVGLALKRLYPESRILLITGSAKTQMMVGRGSLDWIKLPSYQTILTGGKSEGRDGEAGFYKSVLGNLRTEMIADMVAIIGSLDIVGEIIALEGADAIVQAYESTEGLRPGEPVEGLGHPLTVELGPGMLEGIFDGVQRPLSEIAQLSGDNIRRGLRIDPQRRSLVASLQTVHRGRPPVPPQGRDVTGVDEREFVSLGGEDSQQERDEPVGRGQAGDFV